MPHIQEHLAVALQSKELQPQEQKHLENGEEMSFKKAITNPIIKNSPLDQLEAVLRLVMLKIGLRAENLPSREEKAVLIDHIITSYGNHTVEEIRLAFEMALANKLNLSEKEIVCYENFSCLYFSKIMNAYRAWAIEAHKFLSNKKPMAVIDDKKELADEEMAEWMMEWKNKEEIDIDLIPIMFYEFLDSKKIITLTNTQKWEYTSKGATYVKAKLQDEIGNCKTNDAYLAYNKFQNQETTGFNKEFAGRIKNRAKRLIVYDYLKDKL